MRRRGLLSTSAYFLLPCVAALLFLGTSPPGRPPAVSDSEKAARLGRAQAGAGRWTRPHPREPGDRGFQHGYLMPRLMAIQFMKVYLQTETAGLKFFRDTGATCFHVRFEHRHELRIARGLEAGKA
jgi:hypothetical protein